MSDFDYSYERDGNYASPKAFRAEFFDYVADRTPPPLLRECFEAFVVLHDKLREDHEVEEKTDGKGPEYEAAKAAFDAAETAYDAKMKELFASLVNDAPQP